MSDVDPILPEDCEEELKQALLAAFGDDAMDMHDDFDLLEDQCEPQSIPTTITTSASPGNENELAAPGRSFSRKLVSHDQDSPRTHWVKELYRSIYASRESQPSGLTVHFGNPKHQDLTARYVVFVIGDQQFAVPLRDVREIARKSKITELPGTPSWLYGATNLRGQILSVTDLRNLLDISGARPTVGEKIIVLHSSLNSLTTAVVADRVIGIRCGEKEPSNSHEMSDSIARVASGVATFESRPTVLIDTNKLLGCSELTCFT